MAARDDERALEDALALLDDYDDAHDLFDECADDAPAVAFAPTLEPTPTPNIANTTNSPTETQESTVAEGAREPPRAAPKRVRKRQKDELIYLRSRVNELQERLTRLQKKSRVDANADANADANVDANADANAPPPPSPVLSSMSSTSASSGDDDDAEKRPPKPSAQLAAVWEKVAARQYEQRQQAEIENAKLKEMLEEQIRVARSLERVLRRRANTDLLKSKSNNKVAWNRVATKEEEAAMFQDMLQGLERQFSEVPTVFTAERFASRGAIFRDIQVRMTGEDVANLPEEDLGEMYVEVLDSKILPFDLASTAAAFWQHMTGNESSMKSLFRKTVELTDDTMARSFGVEINAGPMKGEFRGKQCVRRYQEEDRTIIVWNMLAEPIELSGMFMGGLLVRQKAWIELTPSAEDPTQATQLRARYVMTPDVYDDDAPDQERKVGAITDFVIHSTHGNLNSSHQMIENILIQSMLQKNA